MANGLPNNGKSSPQRGGRMPMISPAASLSLLFLLFSSVNGFQLQKQLLVPVLKSRQQPKISPYYARSAATSATARSPLLFNTVLNGVAEGKESPPKVNGGSPDATIVVGDCKTDEETCLTSLEDGPVMAAESISHASSPAITRTPTIKRTTQHSTNSNYDIRRFRCASYLLVQAAGVGILSGWSVGIFKVLIDTVKNLSYMGTATARPWLRLLWLPLIPAMGGVIVSLLSKLGGGFPPGLKDTIQSVDGNANRSNNNNNKEKASAAYHPIFHQFRFIKKSLASVVTLGTGCSLGPEGPSVEIGMNLSRLIMDVFPTRTAPDVDENAPDKEAKIREYALQQRRLLLACGAAAGVSAGFNAPIAGAFFALEIMQQAFTSIDKNREPKTSSVTTEDDQISLSTVNTPTLTASGSVSAILLSSVLSALVCQSLLGEHLHLALKDYHMNTPLLELPLYLLLGATSGLAAFLFSQATNVSRSLFQGNCGPGFLRRRFANLSPLAKPALGGLFCGMAGLVFPQVLFSGYDTINIVLANRMLPTLLLLSLLGMKMLTTAVAAGSGLVGGTFAPSLFLGGMVGASFHNIVSWLFENAAHHGTSITLASPMMQMAGLPAYTMVGAATVLAAVFRAPLTASLLLFEMTRDYGAILPLMASSGVASVVGDILEAKQEGVKRRGGM